MIPIQKHPVKHPLLKQFINYFWSTNHYDIQINHTLIPQCYIMLRINLSETPRYYTINNTLNKLEDIYFTGLQDHFINCSVKVSGKEDAIGICFYPDGFYPFINIPVNEFNNNMFGVDEIGLGKIFSSFIDQLKSISDIESRISLLESKLVSILINNKIQAPNNFRVLFHSITNSYNSQITDICKKNNCSVRTIERLYNKYIGLSPVKYNSLNRFHIISLSIANQNFSKLSDLAYDGGYFDQAHFNRFFRRFTGSTPKQLLYNKESTPINVHDIVYLKKLHI